jgi:hypothetical protein
MHWLFTATIVGAGRELLKKGGFIKPDPATLAEQRKYEGRQWALIMAHTIAWGFCLSWFFGYPDMLWVFFIWGVFLAHITGSLMNRKLEQYSMFRIRKSVPKKGFWKEFWDEDSNPKVK